MELYPIDLAIHVVNLVVLFLILRALLFQPIRKFMAARENAIAAQLQEAETAQAQAEQLKTDYTAKLEKAEDECRAIIAKGYREGSEHAEDIEKEARHAADQLLSQAKLEAKDFKQQAMNEAQDALTDLAVDMAGRVLRFDEETKKRVASGSTAKSGRRTGVLKVAAQPDAEGLSAITARLEALLGCSLTLTVEVDESLIGGYAAYVDGRVYDFSYAAQLQSLKQKLS